MSPPALRGEALTDSFRDTLCEIVHFALKLSGLMLASLAPAWLVTQYQLLALARAGDAMAVRMGLVSITDVDEAGKRLLDVFWQLGPYIAAAYLGLILLVRILTLVRTRTTIVRCVGGVLSAGITLFTLVLTVVGYYQYTTLGGLAAGVTGSLLFGWALVPLNYCSGRT